MAEKRSLFARQRGIAKDTDVQQTVEVHSFQIRERSTEEMQRFMQRESSPQEAGFPEAVSLDIPQTAANDGGNRAQSAHEMDDISRENLHKISTMSPAELAAAQAELRSALTPEQIAFLRSRGAAKAKQAVRTADVVSDEHTHTCMTHNSKPEHSEDRVKFDYTGEVTQRFEHGQWTHSEFPGLTITETLLLARSLVPAQRILALQLISKIIAKRGTPALNHMITHCGLLLVLRTALDDSATTVFTAGLETLTGVIAQELERDWSVERFDGLLYPRVATASQNALLRADTKAKSEFVEEQESRYDNAPEDPSEEAETDIDLSCQDFIGTLINTGLLMRVNYLLRTHSEVVNKESIGKVVLACAMHSVSGSFAVVRTQGLLEQFGYKASVAGWVYIAVLTTVCSASHSLAIAVYKLRDAWVGYVTENLLRFAEADKGTLAAWDLLDQLLRYKIQPIPYEAFIEPIRGMVGKCKGTLTDAQGKTLEKVFSALARRERVHLDTIPAYIELAKAVVDICSEQTSLSLGLKHTLAGAVRLISAVIANSTNPRLDFLENNSRFLCALAVQPLAIRPFSQYHAMTTEYSSSLPRLNLYVDSSAWEEQDRIEVSLRAAVVTLLLSLSPSASLNFDSVLQQITALLVDSCATIEKAKIPNILAYRLQDFPRLCLAMLQHMEARNCNSSVAQKCAHAVVPFLGQYTESYLHYVLSKWLFRGIDAPGVLTHYLGLVSTSEHLQRSERYILQEPKLTSYTLSLSENRFLPVQFDYLYQSLRTDTPHDFLPILLALESSNCIDYCPVHMKLAVLNEFLAVPNIVESDPVLIQILEKLADKPDFASRLGEIKENVFAFLRFYLAASYCSPLLSRWLAVYLRPEVADDIRRYILQETEALFPQITESIGNQVIGRAERYRSSERSAFVLDFYSYIRPRVRAETLFGQIIAASLSL